MKPSAAALIVGLGAALGFGPELADARQRHVAAKGRPGAKARRAKNKKQRQQKKASRK